MANNRLHVRSASLTSKTNPIIARIENELKKLKAREASSTSTTGKVSLGLSGLGDLYRCVDDVLSLPLTQQALSLDRHSRCVNNLVEECSALLDICCSTKEIITLLMEASQGLQFALTSKDDDQLTNIETTTANYNSSRKKTMKQAHELIMSLKKMDYSFGSSTLFGEDDHLLSVLRALRCVVIISISVNESLLSFLSSPVSKPSRSNKWSLAKLMQKGNVSSKVQPENRNELQMLDVSLSKALWTGDRVNSEKLQEVSKKFMALHSEMGGIVNGSDSFSKQLVKTRASLLKIVSL